MKHLTLTAVSFLLIGLTMSGTAYSQVPVWEREALIAFYNATGGDNWQEEASAQNRDQAQKKSNSSV
jgi:hypothetical protein